MADKNGKPREEVAQALEENETAKSKDVSLRILNDAEWYACELVAVHMELARVHQRIGQLEAERSTDRVAELRKEHNLPESFTWKVVAGMRVLQDTTPK